MINPFQPPWFAMVHPIAHSPRCDQHRRDAEPVQGRQELLLWVGLARQGRQDDPVVEFGVIQVGQWMANVLNGEWLSA